MNGIAQRLADVRAQIAAACAACGRDPGEVALLAVSKTRPAAEVRAALAAGQLAFGENRVQDLAPKAAELRDTAARWHFIGSLQTNKVRTLLQVEALELLHSVDRSKLVHRLAEGIAELRPERPLDVLLQIDATGEPEKHGVEPAAAESLAREVVACAPAVRLVGLMAMGPLDADPAPVFAAVAALRERLRDALGLPLPTLSLGMTGDLAAAIAAGSTLVRVGTGVFGPRG
ncbi:MAG: YggS family pyridoxal phosphate-dependent enzyme [Planctomycetes bacterium]|nr:YggS family pyridoxal phosphate-dependent enzyme [Planctomycetota bacterium]